ncbi:MAG: reverse transcriptase domain-containing protein, partial [bacterium]
MEVNNILTPDQFGFRKAHSAVHPMVHMMNFVSRALKKKETAIAIFCDIRKAFDTVNHDILLKKMHKMGIRGVELDWFKNYLSNRKQFVYLNGKSSSLLEILLGVPQGSILGPIL